MKVDPASRSNLDLCAVSLSGLCILHCAALPILATLIPAAAVAAEAEWLHKVLVLLAAPMSLRVIIGGWNEGGNLTFVLVALSGLTLLLAAAFVANLEAYELWLSIVGATLVGGAHLHRWLNASGQYSMIKTI
ncbi:MAG: MerC domain-containing protein [Lysobacterales bacterium]